jgi:EAL and modified HD-GYP domain-containing signal transduction protein
MNDDPTCEIEYANSPALKVLMGREPVLGRQQNLVGHEILFRSNSVHSDPLRQQLDISNMLEHAAEAGMEHLAGNGLGFVTATASFLEGDSVLFLPQKNFIIILPAALEVTDALILRIAELRRIGFRFALDQNQLNTPNGLRLLAQAEIIRVELPPPPQLLTLDPEQLRRCKMGQIHLFAQQVQEVAQFEHCMRLGFDYFSGTFYSRPVFLENIKFSAAQLIIIKALELLNQDADDNQIEQAIKRDAVIALTILKHVNSASAGVTQRIGSLKQAIQIVGRAKLTSWLEVMLYEKPNGQANGAALFTLATSRAKLLELLACSQLPHRKIAPDIGFIVGLMSMMDTLFGMPMADVLEKIPVYAEVRLALLERKGTYGQLLQVVEYLEQLTLAEPPLDLLLPMLEQLHVPLEELYALQRQVFIWVSQLD